MKAFASFFSVELLVPMECLVLLMLFLFTLSMPISWPTLLAALCKKILRWNCQTGCSSFKPIRVEEEFATVAW